MRQPRARRSMRFRNWDFCNFKLQLVGIALLLLSDTITGERINSSPRRRRQDVEDVTTVLLVDSHGRSQFGRFLNVKPDVGVITSTARTFIQEGVTTEYATKVLGTTLDNGRLYAHLLTKSSRVLYDNDGTQTRTSNNFESNSTPKKWHFEQNFAAKGNFVRNIDLVSPNQVDSPFVVFPTTSPLTAEKIFKEESKEIVDEELLQEPSNNPRVPFEESRKESRVFSVSSSSNNNVKVFQINSQNRHIDLHQQKAALDSEENDVIRKDELGPSKVREWDNLPTFTVRNEFSPSGFSFLGDLPDFDINTERSKQTTAAERRAKLLFKGGIPNKQDLKTVTYTGFADFTTTVGDTVIVFSPQSAEKPKPTSQIIRPSLRPTSTLNEPPIATRIKTFLNHEPGLVTETVEGHKLTMQKSLPTMVIESASRTPKEQVLLENAVDATTESKEKHTTQETPQLQDIKTTSGSTIIFAPIDIEPSESSIPMLSTPSDEDIAKIFASLQAKAAQQATEPLNTPSTIFFEAGTTSKSEKPLGGATTIFFDDDDTTETSTSIQSSTAALTTTPKQVLVENLSEQSSSTEGTSEEESLEKQTTENVITTTKLDTTTNEIPITTDVQPETTTLTESDESKESNNDKKICEDGFKVVPSTSYKTLTYFTTFFIPGEEGETSTSIKSNQVVSTEIIKETQNCIAASKAVTSISPSEIPTTTSSETTTEPVTESEESELTTTEIPTTTLEVVEEKEDDDEDKQDAPTTENVTAEITTESRHVTESEPETTEMTTENGDEIELLFKTLYTTYTYLTTYFQESTSSVASRKVVITNVITSTLDPSAQASEDPIAELINQDFKSKPVTFEDFAEIAPSGVGIGRPTSLPDGSVDSPEGDHIYADSSKATPALSAKNILNTANAIKTYYTTYTYFTTIFVDGETEISSRTEVYTNYLTPSASIDEIEATPTISLDDDGVKSKIMALDLGSGNYNSTINRHKPIDNNIDNVSSSILNESSENDLLDLSEYETISTMVTDVRRSTSRGEKRILDNDKRNVLLDDQIVSESNNESEIIPSPTLLLQTSYTTFTYFTTMYQGTTASNVVSRLETITNVVTETLTPTHTLSVEDLSLPITYFTTFTYWTTLYKEGTTKVTSREETVSNVVTPTPGDNIGVTAIPEIEATSVLGSVKLEATKIPEQASSNPIAPLASSETLEASVEPTKTFDDNNDQTTYYTTYTYYTTSYVGNSTVLNSRLETVTNIVNKTAELDNQIGRAIGQGILNTVESGIEVKDKEVKPTGLLSTIKTTIENSGTPTILSTDVYGTYIDGLYAKVLESTSIIVTDPISTTETPSSSITSSSVEENLKPTGVVSINQGQIVDADGISTLFYTTKAVGTYIDNLYAQIIESTSSFKVDEAKKADQTEQPPAHRTGLVRLIEGSIVHSHTTTVYQSKVLGTVIDGRYAQIIESTSSFISMSTIAPTATQNVPVKPTTSISPQPVVIEGSISDTTGSPEDSTESVDDEENTTEDIDGRVKSRLTFQSRKRTFTPVIRPFASRAKPTFAPKRKGTKAASATTITRSDFTPTVTAIPATKSGSRFGGGRKSSSFSSILPTASGSRRFSRPKSSSTAAIGITSSFSPNRGRSSGRVQSTVAGFGSSTRRTGGFRTSAVAPAPIRPSSSFNPNNRFARIRPTSTFNNNRNVNSVTLPSTISDEENDLTTQVTDEPNTVDENETTTTALETTSSRRSNNPLLRFRRPPLSRPTSVPRTTAKAAASTQTANRSTNGRNGRVTTTSQPKSTRLPPRSNSISSRARPANSLFPRRNLFTTTTTPEPEEEEEQEELDDEIENNANEDTEFEGTDTNTQTERVPSPLERRSRENPVLIKPFIRKRAKRQTTYSRFRRPTSRTTPAPVEEEPETEPPRTRSRYSSYNGRSRTTNPPRISPSKPNSRSQFTLRDSSNSRSSNFRRPSTVSSNLRKPTPRPASRLSSSLRSSNTERTTSTNNKSRKNSRRRGSPRGKVTDIDSNYVLPGSDGTITVTHQIPTEVTIPVVNGKITEYKNIVTAKLITEILTPKQYSTTTNPFGKDITVLLSESTGFGPNGAQQITKYTLNESPTTTVIFTPTYIRGRKTSFSHVIPSTVYMVDPIVNTITPAIPQAPLANILLSQLLLGQQQSNPLLGLQQPGAVAGTPTTEFKTRTTTYVTTVTSETSTVIPLTFRGKEILTTIIDSNTNVITATEFVTDTVVVTPTPVLQQNQQLNSLLVPLLLQQQQQQQQQQINPLFQQQAQLIQNPAGVINANSNEELFKKSLFQESEQTKQNLALDEEIDSNEDYQVVDDSTENLKKPIRANKKPKKPATPETSVITLYVSGRTPGEFSTVLSTVVVGEENKKKREATYVPVQPSKIHDDLIISTLEYVDTYVMPAMGDIILDHSEPAINTPTESLESILGDVSKKVVTDIPVDIVKPTKPSSIASKKYNLKYEKVTRSGKPSGNFLAL